MECKVGDIILGEFVVRDVKRGTFGIVYMVYRRQKKGILAVKSLQDKYFYREDKIADEVVLYFRREAEVWVKLGSHENIVEAFFVEVLDYKPYIFMEYVDGGSLRGSLVRGRLSVPDALFFAIQFCDGMIYANRVDLGEGRRGVVHRDIKPENIMLTKDGVLKITDFGLVKALGAPSPERLFGSPEYMSPEQFETMDVDTRADIYSFGVVLYEMLIGRPPFYISTKNNKERWEFCKRHHKETDPLPPRQIDPSIPEEPENTVLKCLEKKPKDRYQSFEALREELMEVYRSRFGHIPEVKKRIRKVTAARLTARGFSLARLGKPEESMKCFDGSLEINPRYGWAWVGKGDSLTAMRRWRAAITCYDRALEINPRYGWAWVGKGNSLSILLRYEEAIKCYDRALEINPRDLGALSYKGITLWSLGRHEEAIMFFDRLLEIDPRQVGAWVGKGMSVAWLGRHEEAIKCFDRALKINPRSALTWYSKGASLATLGRYRAAITCYDRALKINPRSALTWYGKGVSLNKLGRHKEAKECLRKAAEIDPRFLGR